MDDELIAFWKREMDEESGEGLKERKQGKGGSRGASGKNV